MFTKNRAFLFSVAKVISLLVTLVISTIGIAQDVETSELAKACQSKSGKWLEKYSECENADRQWCAASGGKFDECVSACRHNPDPTAPCTMQCVSVCTFPAKVAKPDTESPSKLDQAVSVMQGGAVAAANAKSGNP